MLVKNAFLSGCKVSEAMEREAGRQVGTHDTHTGVWDLICVIYNWHLLFVVITSSISFPSFYFSLSSILLSLLHLPSLILLLSPTLPCTSSHCLLTPNFLSTLSSHLPLLSPFCHAKHPPTCRECDNHPATNNNNSIWVEVWDTRSLLALVNTAELCALLLWLLVGPFLHYPSHLLCH